MTQANKSLSKDEFFAAIEAVELQPVELAPEKLVYVRTVDFEVIRACRASARKAVSKAGDEQDNAFGRQVIAACVCDENGNLLLSHDDAGRLLKSQIKAFKKLVSAALKVNGLTDDENDAEKKE